MKIVRAAYIADNGILWGLNYADKITPKWLVRPRKYKEFELGTLFTESNKFIYGYGLV